MSIDKYHLVSTSIHKYQNKIIFIFLLFFLVVPIITNTQVSLSIFPEKFDLELARGEIYKDKIIISNLSPEVLSINIQIKNFSARGERGEMIFEEGGDISFNPSQWIKFQNEQFILEPNESKELGFVIEVPQTAEPGGHYATTFFQTEIPSGTEGVRIVPTLGTPFLLKIKGAEEKYPPLEKQFELVELTAPSFVEIGPVAINFRLKNNDPVHIRVGGKLIIYNFFGRIKEEIKIKEQTILPQKTRFFEIKTSDKKFFDKFFLGPYKAELIFATPIWRGKIGNERQLVKNIKFYGFPWKIILVFLVVVLLIIFICLVKRKGRRNHL